MDSTVTLSSGIRLAARIFPGNSKNSVPLFCIHGLTGNLRNFEPIARTLSKNGITVVTYDLRGRGNSDKPKSDYSARLHAEDLKQLANALGFSKISILSHSLGCWITLRFAEKYPELLSKAILVDGGGELSVFRKISNLIMISTSLSRLGRVAPSKEYYLSEARKSPILSAWNENIRNFLIYELESTGTLATCFSSNGEKGPIGPVRCSLPPYVIESELRNMGGSMHLSRIPGIFFRNPSSMISILKDNRALPYSALQCPVLVVRAGKPNFRSGDELLPDSAIERMKRKIPGMQLLDLKNLNHYEIVLLEDENRDKELIRFLKS
ncbi:alpha/beta hydrolase [Leptospira perolatii]|uniref:Alpha/beta hydrolase n=1 Tax=Leptospira perolatii TaxID=2023191 RepID=A0A2M9ZQZ2_9LEPT|nr:alpha/beta hydrolase [Leptospira perolatii]PJZ74482.1 alpha/beta hydrolase [Leptospira perolatii]